MMKKGLICFVLILLFMLTACKTSTTVTTTDDGVSEPVVKVEKTTDSGVNIVDKPSASSTSSLPSDVITLLGKGRNSMKNIQYNFRRTPNLQELHIINVLGDKIIHILPEANQYLHKEYFDTIYLDTNKKTAVGFCENRRNRDCPEPNKEFEVRYEDYIEMVLYDDWIDNILSGTNYVSKGKEQLESGNGKRDVDVFDVEIRGITHRISVDKFYGVPMRIEIFPDSDVDGNRPSDEFRYEILSVGKNKPADMDHKMVTI